MNQSVKHLLLPSILMLFLTACNNQFTNQTQENLMTESCQNLYKVETVDDLIKQFYDNIDSHCLFEMDTTELERIWGVRVFDFYKQTSRGDKDKLIKELHSYTMSENAIYVEKLSLDSEEIILRINPTSPYMARNNGGWKGSLGLGQFPKYLPEPNKISALPFEVSRPPLVLEDNPRTAPKSSVYNSYSFYWWINSNQDKDKPMLEIATGMDGLPASPTLYSNSDRFF